MKYYETKSGQVCLRKGRVSLPHQAYFITKCTLPHFKEFLVKPDLADILINSIKWARDNNWWRILGFSIMPGHYHLSIALGETKDLSSALASVDRFTSTNINRKICRQGEFWEQGYYDHAIRDRHDFDDILDYIHTNAVIANLVNKPEDWPYSTANPKYAQDIDWEWLGPSLPVISDTKYRFDRRSIPLKYA